MHASASLFRPCRLFQSTGTVSMSAILLTVMFSIVVREARAQVDPTPPKQTTRLLFIHHSVGENLLNPEQGGLLAALNQNHYYVFDTNYDWGPLDQDVNDGYNIGTHTDIGHWYNWFLGPHRDVYTNAIYRNNLLTDWLQNDASLSDPGGENNIILFKSCFNNGQVFTGSVLDAPLQKGLPNPLAGIGVDVDATAYTVSNIKGLYRDLLDYFATRQDKLFVLLTSPPSAPGVADASMPLLRAIDGWLVQYWLRSYGHNNVAVFDFGNVLTSNGGDVNTPDIGATTGSHHRFRNGAIEHVLGTSPYLAYGQKDPNTGEWDNHPTTAGSQKGTAEFLPILNIAYNAWHGATGMASSENAGAAASCMAFPQPAGDAVQLTWNQQSDGAAQLELFDLHGRVVARWEAAHAAGGRHTLSLNTAEFPDGMYLFRIIGPGATHRGRIVIRH
jgi:hypothetical protein